MQIAKLINISPDANHNKFYNMTQIDDQNFEVNYGRVGNKGMVVKYPMRDWDKMLRAKKSKGYSDVTSNNKIVRIGDANFNNLKPKVKDLLMLLNKYAKEAFKLNYTVEISDVSEQLVIEAQEIIDKINGKLAIGVPINEITMLLLSLYKKIPRKIKKVSESMIKPILTQQDLDNAYDKLTVEQGLLDVVKGQLENGKDVSDPVDAAVDGSPILSYLDKLGLDIDEISASEEQMLKDLMGPDQSKYMTAYKVINLKTQKLFDSEVGKSADKKTMMLFHGSRSENWMSIIRTGLQLHPNAVTTGKLFDNGIYFANSADKSLGYISGGRWNGARGDNDNWLAVYEVHVGKQATYNDLPGNSHVDLAQWVPQNGFDSYFADHRIERRYNLRRDEFIIYNEAKCTIKYLIHI